MTDNNPTPMIDGEIFVYFCQLLRRYGMYVDNLESKDNIIDLLTMATTRKVLLSEEIKQQLPTTNDGAYPCDKNGVGLDVPEELRQEIYQKVNMLLAPIKAMLENKTHK